MGLIVAGLNMDSDLFRQGRGPLVQVAGPKTFANKLVILSKTFISRAEQRYDVLQFPYLEMFFHPLAPARIKKKKRKTSSTRRGGSPTPFHLKHLMAVPIWGHGPGRDLARTCHFLAFQNPE
jgi:hypothetical protein